jgi:two-component system chemotaxis response regulator CheY
MGIIQNHASENCEPITRKRKILVVDDDDVVRDMVLNMLLSIGCETIGAADALEGLHIFQGHDCNIIVTDMDMPGMDGLHFAAHIKEISPRIPVVLMTGQGREQILEKVKGNYIDWILYKPFGFEELEATIQHLVNDKGCFKRRLVYKDSPLENHEKRSNA